MYYEIEISCDHEDGQRFVEWLQEQGHDAHVGASTGNYVDGVSTSSPEAQQVINDLWEAYCNA